KMTGNGTTKAAFEPAALTIKPGTTVRFVNVSGGPHNVAFYADSVPKGGADALKKGMPNPMGDLTGPFLTQPNEKYDVSFTGAPGPSSLTAPGFTSRGRVVLRDCRAVRSVAPPPGRRTPPARQSSRTRPGLLRCRGGRLRPARAPVARARARPRDRMEHSAPRTGAWRDPTARVRPSCPPQPA